MYNPLKMSSDDKQMLLGGIASSLIYYGNLMAEGVKGYPTVLNQQIDPHIPKNGELLAGLAPPVALYAVVKFGHKERFASIADGSIYFGIPNIIERTIADSATAQGQATRPAATLNATLTTSKYTASMSTSLPIPRPMSLSKYVVTS